MLRIVAGKLGGRRIAAPPGRGTRPTSEKVRAALFNALERWLALEGARVVDLYAGSGALGIEAFSRGAAHVVFVEDDRRTAAALRATLKELAVPREQVEVAQQKVLAWLRRSPGGPPAAPPSELPTGPPTGQSAAPLTGPPTAPLIDLVLLDPPYAAGEYDAVLKALAGWAGLAAGALIVVEASAKAPPPAPPELEVLRAKRYGDTQLVFLRRAAPQPDAAGMP
jgi:16S rRNA (guanine966-N2)-methyltransferase